MHARDAVAHPFQMLLAGVDIGEAYAWKMAGDR
jgi:hypothetical protein